MSVRVESGETGGIPVDAHPEHVAVFNANVCVEPSWKLWYGDLDLTLDQPRLLALARLLDRTVYVLYESDGRFGGRDQKPLIERAVYTARPDGSEELSPGIERGPDGHLRNRP